LNQRTNESFSRPSSLPDDILDELGPLRSDSTTWDLTLQNPSFSDFHDAPDPEFQRRMDEYAKDSGRSFNAKMRPADNNCAEFIDHPVHDFASIWNRSPS